MNYERYMGLVKKGICPSCMKDNTYLARFSNDSINEALVCRNCKGFPSLCETHQDARIYIDPKGNDSLRYCTSCGEECTAKKHYLHVFYK